jgi:Do/DeqQ family serine protease
MKRVMTVLVFFFLSLALFAQSGTQLLEKEQEAYRLIAQKVKPAVVEIGITKGDQMGLGSGIVVQKDGEKIYILTNNHVAGDADKINVRFSDGRAYKAKLVGKDDKKDLALIEIDTKDSVTVAELGNSDNLQVGDIVIAIGSPLGFSSTVTQGIISAVGREPLPGSDLAQYTDYIQTDAAINPGNSGGALVNIYGQVIGINSWIASQSGGSAGLGFAIPINKAKADIKDFLTKGKVDYGWLGVEMTLPNPDIVADMKLQALKGVFVYSIVGGSPADKSGLLPGDFVTTINGIPVKDDNSVLQTVGSLAPGSVNKFELLRQGKETSLDVTIELRPSESALAKSSNKVWPGMSVVDVDNDVRKQLDLKASDGDVVINNVESGSIAGNTGFRSGDVIQKLNGRVLKNTADFYEALNSISGKASFEVYRDGTIYKVSMEKQ